MNIRAFISKGVVMGALLLVVPGAFAEETPSSAPQQPSKEMRRGRQAGAGDAERRLQHLSTRLGLSDEQKQQIKPILEEEAAKIKEIRKDPNLTKAQMQTKMRETRDASYERIKPILTPEQQKKHDEMRKRPQDRKPRK